MVKWDENGFYLFTAAEFLKLPDGIELTCIDGTRAIKGQDEIDQDTRFGHIAYGVHDPFNHPEKHLFLTFVLSA